MALVPEIPREVHGGHAALPELALDGVAVGQGGGERVNCGHKVVRVESDWNVWWAGADCQQALH
jgi:hypothetical protein